MKKRIQIKYVVGIIIIVLMVIVMLFHFKKNILVSFFQLEPVKVNTDVTNEENFNTNLIKEVNKLEKSNYLISPYSLEMLLKMLQDATDYESYLEITKAIGNREMKVIKNQQINVYNASFIKDIYKRYIKDGYKYHLLFNYDADLIYDKFTSPNVINNWINDKTKGKIPKLIDQLPDNFFMALVNAVNFESSWKNNFECKYTTEEKFTKLNGNEIKVSMMHKVFSETSDDVSYFENDDAKGIIMPYKEEKESKLEFIGILPNDIDSYINNITDNDLKNIYGNVRADSNNHVVVNLPRFSYEYNLSSDKLNDIMKNLGIKRIFNDNDAEFNRMADLGPLKKIGIENLYVSDMIHKTKIEVDEKGTKAAAVSGAIIVGKNAVADYTTYSIEFTKPFIYFIRDKINNEILFFGVTYEPNLWNGSTCQ